jgi:hypothetical protein
MLGLHCALRKTWPKYGNIQNTNVTQPLCDAPIAANQLISQAQAT